VGRYGVHAARRFEESPSRSRRCPTPGSSSPRMVSRAGAIRFVVGSPASCQVGADRCRRAPQPRGPWLPRPALAPGRRRRVRARGHRLRRGAGSGSGAVPARGAGMGRGSRPRRSRCVPASVLPPSQRVPAGGADHDSGGERSSPSQVWRRGMVPSSAKAVLVSENLAIAHLPCDHRAFRLLDGPSGGRLNRSRGAGRSRRRRRGSRPGSPPASAAALPGSGGAQSRRPPPPTARPCRAGPRR
jgi:hypothetical protein